MTIDRLVKKQIHQIKLMWMDDFSQGKRDYRQLECQEIGEPSCVTEVGETVTLQNNNSKKYMPILETKTSQKT